MTFDKQNDSEVNQSQRFRLYPPGIHTKPTKSSKQSQKNKSKTKQAPPTDNGSKTLSEKVKASMQKQAALTKSKKSKNGEKDRPVVVLDSEEDLPAAKSKKQKKH